MTPLRCILLVAREHGLAVARELARQPDRFTIAALFTHRLEPASYDPGRGERKDYPAFAAFAQTHTIPFYSIDKGKDGAVLKDVARSTAFDFLLAVSWRFLVVPQVLAQPRIGAINLHRGDLPAYAGAEPIRRALEDGQPSIAVCAHRMTERIDEGEVLCRAYHPAGVDPTRSIPENVERLKREITPLFPRLAIEALNHWALDAGHGGHAS